MYVTWGDGDRNNDYSLGEQWFNAGVETDGKIQTSLLGDAVTQELNDPNRADEIAALRKMPAKLKFDFNTLYK